MLLTSVLRLGMLPVTTLGTLLLLYVKRCLSNVPSLVGTGRLLN